MHAASVARMRCENLENPIGIDATQPRLSWNMQSDERGALQSGYQILVASSESLLKEGKADLWDSSRVDSDQSINIGYGGKASQVRPTLFLDGPRLGQKWSPMLV